MKLARKVFWWGYIVVLSCRWISRLNLGDVVIWRGRRWVAVQGVSAPTWEIQEIGSFDRAKVHIDDLRKERSIGNYVGSFLSGYRFYMTAWFDIWVRSGIEQWMRECNIWARKP